MRNPQGYAVITEDQAVEYDTASCVHCQSVIFVKPGTGCTTYLTSRVIQEFGETAPKVVWDETEGAFCRNCMGSVCLPCHDRGVCTHWQKMIDLQEARGRTHRSIEQTLGHAPAP